MKFNLTPTFGLTLVAALTLPTMVLAAGNHAHGHDQAATSIGQPGVATQVSRTLNVEMSDNMRFTPATIQVKRGETIRFVIKNAGQLKHEFSLGTQQELAEHYEMMKRFPDMEHDEPNKISLAPAKTGEIIWHFTQAGLVDFACLHPGHYDAGMKGQVKVSR